ncbi:MAG: hypothetical protein V4501_00185 [Pseudomonadota bacterium]
MTASRTRKEEAPYHYHHAIIRCMYSLGYLTGPEGKCDGISFMALQAIFGNDVKSFNDRLATICDFDHQLSIAKSTLLKGIDIEFQPKSQQENFFNVLTNLWLLKAISYNLKSEVLKRTLIEIELNPKYSPQQFINVLSSTGLFAVLSSEQPLIKDLEEKFAQKVSEILLNIPDRVNLLAFFDGVILYQSPQHYEFGEKDRRVWLENSRYAISKLTEDMGGFTSITEEKFSGIYSCAELTTLLKTLGEALTDYEHTIVLQLHSCNHAIYVGYDPKAKVWYFSDANQFPIKFISEEDDVSAKIMKGFFTENIVTFNTNILALKKFTNELLPFIANWKNQSVWQTMHALTPEKAKQTELEGANWLYIACAKGDISTVKALLLAGANPNPFLKKARPILDTLGNMTIQDPHLANELAICLLQNGSIPNRSAVLSLGFQGNAEVKSLLENEDFSKRRDVILTKISYKEESMVKSSRDNILQQTEKMYLEGAQPELISAAFIDLQKLNLLTSSARANAVLKIKKMCIQEPDVAEIEASFLRLHSLDLLAQEIREIINTNKASFSTPAEFEIAINNSYDAFAICEPAREAFEVENFKKAIETLCTTQRQGVLPNLFGFFGVKTGPVNQVLESIHDSNNYDAASIMNRITR